MKTPLPVIASGRNNEDCEDGLPKAPWILTVTVNAESARSAITPSSALHREVLSKSPHVTLAGALGAVTS
jgi:hypothetical protein